MPSTTGKSGFRCRLLVCCWDQAFPPPMSMIDLAKASMNAAARCGLIALPYPRRSPTRSDTFSANGPAVSMVSARHLGGAPLRGNLGREFPSCRASCSENPRPDGGPASAPNRSHTCCKCRAILSFSPLVGQKCWKCPNAPVCSHRIASRTDAAGKPQHPPTDPQIACGL